MIAIDEEGGVWAAGEGVARWDPDAGAWDSVEVVDASPADSGRISFGPDGTVLAVWVRHSKDSSALWLA